MVMLNDQRFSFLGNWCNRVWSKDMQEDIYKLNREYKDIGASCECLPKSNPRLGIFL